MKDFISRVHRDAEPILTVGSTVLLAWSRIEREEWDQALCFLTVGAM